MLYGLPGGGQLTMKTAEDLQQRVRRPRHRARLVHAAQHWNFGDRPGGHRADRMAGVANPERNPRGRSVSGRYLSIPAI